MLRCVVTGCKLAKLGSNNIELPKHFSPIFSSFLPYFWYPMNPTNGMCILEFRSFYEYVISLLLHEKTLLYLCEVFNMFLPCFNYQNHFSLLSVIIGNILSTDVTWIPIHQTSLISGI